MKIHLGCWKRNIPGWINVDLCDLPYIHYKRSIDDLSCFEDGCADVVYSAIRWSISIDKKFKTY